MAKKKSLGGTILKIILGIIGVIVLIVIGGYLYLRFALGIDIFDIKNKLDLLKKPVSESTLITDPFNDVNGTDVLEDMFGVNDICTTEEDKTIFNLEAYVQADLQLDTVLSNEELASVFSLFFENVDYTSLGLNDDYSKYLTLKQIKFSNIVVSADSTSADINYIVKFEMDTYKEQISSTSGIVAFLINTFVPNNIYISSTFNIEIPVDSFEDYVVTNKNFLINNLTQQETNSVLDLVNLLSKDDTKTTLPNTINEIFCDALFGGKGSAGLISSIKDLGGVEFCNTDSGIAIVIKKV